MRKQHNYYIYIMTNKMNTVVYTGITNNLARRVWEHKNSQQNSKSFTSRYKLTKLIYYEWFDNVESAIYREKQIKAGSRKQKLELIMKLNLHWEDLSNTLFG